MQSTITKILLWLTDKTNLLLVVIGLSILLIAGAVYFSYTPGYKVGMSTEQALILSQKPDTNTTWTKPISIPPSHATGILVPKPASPGPSRDSLVSAIKDSLETLYGEMPTGWTLDLHSEAHLRINKDTVTVPIETLVDIDPISRIGQALYTFGDVSIPVREILKYVPIEVAPPWYQPAGLIAVGSLATILIFILAHVLGL